MSDNDKQSPDGRRQRKDRRSATPSPYKGPERRNQMVIREAQVFEIYIPPLKGAKERRSAATRRVNPR